MITEPRQVRLYAPTSLRNIDFLTQPIINGATGESWRDQDIADGGQCVNLVDAKVRRYVMAFANVLANPQFKTDTIWVKGTGWVIVPGKPGLATIAGGAGDLAQSGVFTNAIEYVVIVKCSSYTSGTYTPKAGTASDGTITAEGISVHQITANGTGFEFETTVNGTAEFEYMYAMKADDYYFHMALNKRKPIDFAIVDGHNLLDVFPASLARSMKVYHHSSDVFGSATEVRSIIKTTRLLGRRSQFLSFDGRDDKTVVADDPNLDFGIGDGSIVAEVIIKDVTQSVQWYARFQDGNNHIAFEYSAGSQLLHGYAYVGGAYMQRAYTSWTPTVNTKYHLVWTFINGVSNELYINGVAQSLTVDVTTGGDISIAASMNFGEINGGYSEMDLFTVKKYNRNLATKEVEQMALGVPVPEPSFTEIMVNSAQPYDTFTPTVGFEKDSFTAIKTTSGDIDKGGTSDDLPFINGHRYLVEFDLDVNSGDIGILDVRAETAVSGGSSVMTADEFPVVAGANGIVMTCDVTTTGVITWRAGNTGVISFTIRNFYITDLGKFTSFPLEVDKRGKQALVTGWTNNGFVLFSTDGADITQAVANAIGDNCYSVIDVEEDDPVNASIDFNESTAGWEFRVASNLALTADVTHTVVLSGDGIKDLSFIAEATDAFCGFYATANNSIMATSDSIYQILGAVASYSEHGISKEQDEWLDDSRNSLNGIVTGAQFENAPDDANKAFHIMRFDEVQNDIDWYLSINEDGDLPIALQKYGQWLYGKSDLFNITISEEYGGAIDHPGIDVIKTASGMFDATKRYGAQDRFVVPIAFLPDTGGSSWREMEQFIRAVEGMFTPFYMEVVPLNSYDDPIFYRLRLESNEFPFAYVFGNDVPWRVGLACVVDL